MKFARSLRGSALLLALFAPAPLAAQAPPGEAAAEPAPALKPPPKRKPPKAEPVRPVAPQSVPTPAVPTPAAPAPPAKLPELVVVCDAGKAARYEDPKGFVIWVTRSGTITVENPLRPLTPDATRVLQVIIAARVATAYGPDLYALRRGNTPAALENATGGPIRWDAELTVLPDPLEIVSEFGEALAQLAFKECGTAPDVKAVPAAAAKKPPRRKAPAPKPAAAPAEKAPPGLQVPRGAIP